ncbi:MAG: hypothetical protein WD990_10515 [Acidimicrobiia bacterium]
MQTREQWKRSRNWKIVTGAATVATLSLGVLAVAVSAGDDKPSLWVFLDERTSAISQGTPGDLPPLDRGTETEQYADRIAQGNVLFGGGHTRNIRLLSFLEHSANEAGSVGLPPATDSAAEAISDGAAEPNAADETTSADVLSDEGEDAPSDTAPEETDDGLSDDDVTNDGVMEDPVAVADDPLSDAGVSVDAPGRGAEVVAAVRDRLNDRADASNDSPDDSADVSDDSPDDSADDLDDSD